MTKNSDMRLIFAAGLVGGLLEIVWVSFYGLVTGGPIVDVSRQVSATVFGVQGLGGFAASMGVFIHLVLSFVLSASFILFLWKPFMLHRSKLISIGSALCALTLVWAINFYVVLPLVNPSFVKLLPMGVTLISKMLFGLGMGLYLSAQSHLSAQPSHS